MNIAGWNERYLSSERAKEDLLALPTALVVRTAQQFTPGKALDLACGTGRNALWLARHGWETTATDGAFAAIERLQQQAQQSGLKIETYVADLASGPCDIGRDSWDLIVICYYLQRDLLLPALAGVKPGGVLLVIVHITEAGEDGNANRMKPGELRECFAGREILHYREGLPDDPAHKRAVAEIVVRR